MDVVRSGLAALVLGLAISGCADQDPPPTVEESAVDETTPSPEDSPTPSATPPPGADAPAVRQSVADLASRLEVDAAEVEVVAVEEVTWSDGSLGCARRGVMYTQALVDGSRITLRVGATTYEYHAGGGRPFLCERPTQ